MARKDARADHGHSESDEDDSESIVAGRGFRRPKLRHDSLGRRRIAVDDSTNGPVTDARGCEAEQLDGDESKSSDHCDRDDHFGGGHCRELLWFRSLRRKLGRAWMSAPKNSPSCEQIGRAIAQHHSASAVLEMPLKAPIYLKCFILFA